MEPNTEAFDMIIVDNNTFLTFIQKPSSFSSEDLEFFEARDHYMSMESAGKDSISRLLQFSKKIVFSDVSCFPLASLPFDVVFPLP